MNKPFHAVSGLLAHLLGSMRVDVQRKSGGSVSQVALYGLDIVPAFDCRHSVGVLLLGVAYKQDVDDCRESPALRVMEEFQKNGAETAYYDPYVPRCHYQGRQYRGLPALTAETIREYDLVVVTTAHSHVDYGMVAEAGVPVFDCKNVMKNLRNRENIEVL